MTHDAVQHETDAQGSRGNKPSGSPSATQEARRVLGRLSRLCRKELRETLRDRRTVVTLVLMPLLVYPLLAILFTRLQSLSQPAAGQVECFLGLESEANARLFQDYLLIGGQALPRRGMTRQAAQPPSEQSARDNDEPVIRWVIGPDLEAAVANRQVDVAVLIHDETGNARRRSPARVLRFELVYRATSPLGKIGVAYIESRLQAFNERFLAEQLAALGLRVRIPTRISQRPIETRGAAVSLTTLIPLILILMTITGAVYPAIDLTAGERERGTLETLMAAPVPRLELLTAKYVAVVTVALLTATANLLAMSVTLASTGLAAAVFGDTGLTPVLVAQVFALMMLFAAFFSAILLALTSFARSFKEAQAYLIPVMLLALAPGMMSLMPELNFNGVLSVLPLVNIVLLARDLIEGQVDATLATAAVLSTLIYAAASISLAARIFGTDAILYGSQASWSDLLFRPGRRRSEPSVAGATLCLALIFPCYFLSANLLARLSSLSVSMRLALSASVTAILFAILPLTLAAFQRLRIRAAFQLRSANLVSCLAAMLLGATLWPLAHEIFLLNRAIGLVTLSAERIQTAQQLLESWRAISPVFVLVTLAVVPAVCEEFFFRGYLWSALRRSLSPTSTIVVSAAVFGVFHVVVTSALAMERFLPSTFLGLVLGWVCWRTGSVLPGMLLHACHNGLLLMIAYYRDELQSRGWGVVEQHHIPVLWGLAAVVGITLGVVLLVVATRRRSLAAPTLAGDGESRSVPRAPT